MSSTNLQETHTPHDHSTGESTPQRHSSPDKRNTGRILTIVGFVLSGLAVLFVPIILGPVGAVLGGIGLKQGDPLGKWAIVAGITATIVGMVLGFLVFNAAVNS